MTVKPARYKNNRYQSNSDYLYIFENNESLTLAILFLYRQKAWLKSALYKTDKDYRLIITSHRFNPFLLTLKEYSNNYSQNLFEIELTKEHAKTLIAKNAVRIYGKYFAKET